MRRTRPTVLVASAVGAFVVAFLLELGLAAAGVPVFVPPISLPLTLIVVAGSVVGLAIPVRRATKGKARAPINPFRALRVAVLAKAASLSGALLAGAGVGIVVYFATRPLVADPGIFVLSVFAALGGLILMVAGLVGEFLCSIPPGHRGSGSGSDDDVRGGDR